MIENIFLPSGSMMNVQLIESLIQVILALPEEEQVALSQKLAEAQSGFRQLNAAHPPEQMLQPLIATGKIIPPAHHAEIPTILESDLKVMVSNIQVLGKPISETVIEERGEW